MIYLYCGTLLSAQVDSRAAEIEAARDRKAQALEPDTPTPTEQKLVTIRDKKVLERITAGIAGFRVKLGGLASGSGFAVGPEYLRRDLWNRRALFRGAAQASLRRYQKYDLQFSVPPVSRGAYFLELLAVHRDYPQTGYYGPGPDSKKVARSNFRLEDTQWNGTFGVRPVPHLNLAATAGYLLVNVGPGTSGEYVSSEQSFTPAEAVGIDRQADFFRSGFYAQYDYRDNPGGPRSGGNYFVEYNNYSDRTRGLHDFERLDIEVQQYIPFFNKRRVIALRGRSSLTFADDGQRVPFYLQPVLGGSDDLRGFRPFRFYDDNLIVVNGEYRWETFSGLDMAVFADAGKVFPRRAQWNFKDVEGSVGFGLRFNVRNNVFLRTDVGFSHEGFQVWIKFNNIFSEGPVNAPHTQLGF